jgi:hypothetical protein
MTLPRYAATIYESVAAVRAALGPRVTKYLIPLDLADLFVWVLGSTNPDDGVTTIVPNGGTPGAWQRVRIYDRGPDLINGSELLSVSGNRWRVLPAGTLTGPCTKTLDPTYAVAGDWCLVTRLDVSAYAVSLTNGGPAAGTTTMPASSRAWAWFVFDGTDYVVRGSGLML